MALTVSEIQAALAADAELRKGVVTIVAETEEGKTLISNANKAYWDDNIDKKVSELHGMYDKDVEDVLGIKKPDGVKTYSHVKTLMTELKELRANGGKSGDKDVEALRTKIKELEPDALKYRAEFPVWQTKLTEFQKENDTLKGSINHGTVANDLNAGLTGVKLNEAIPEAARQALIKTTFEALTKTAKIEDGKVVYYNTDGSIRRNKQMTPATAGEILADELKVLMQPDPLQGGGADKSIPGDLITVKEGTNDVEELVLEKTKFTTQDEFTTYAHKVLAEKGIAKSDPRHDLIMKRTYIKYEVKKLQIK